MRLNGWKRIGPGHYRSPSARDGSYCEARFTGEQYRGEYGAGSTRMVGGWRVRAWSGYFHAWLGDGGNTANLAEVVKGWGG